VLPQTPEKIIRPFLLYGGLLFTIIRRAVTVGMGLLFIHLFVVTVVPVKGESMQQTLPDGTYILVDELTPRLRPLTRGEIVAFRYPQDPKQKFMKRVIGLPGEAISIDHGNVLLRRSGDKETIRLREPYLLGAETSGSTSHILGPVEYYVLGDNRPASFDSRYFGAVPENLMLGRAWMVLWPLSGLRLVSHFDPLQASQ